MRSTAVYTYDTTTWPQRASQAGREAKHGHEDKPDMGGPAHRRVDFNTTNHSIATQDSSSYLPSFLRSLLLFSRNCTVPRLQKFSTQGQPILNFDKANYSR